MISSASILLIFKLTNKMEEVTQDSIDATDRRQSSGIQS